MARPNPFLERAKQVDLLADALRAHNMRYFPEKSWEECGERVREIWREKAKWIIDYQNQQQAVESS